MIANDEVTAEFCPPPALVLLTVERGADEPLCGCCCRPIPRRDVVLFRVGSGDPTAVPWVCDACLERRPT